MTKKRKSYQRRARAIIRRKVREQKLKVRETSLKAFTKNSISSFNATHGPFYLTTSILFLAKKDPSIFTEDSPRQKNLFDVQ